MAVKREVVLPCQIDQNAGRFHGTLKRWGRFAKHIPIELGFQLVRHRACQSMSFPHILPRSHRQAGFAGGEHKYVLVDLAQRKQLLKLVNDQQQMRFR